MGSPDPGPAGDEPDDATLAQRVISAGGEGSRAAEAELYRRLAPRVRLYGLRHLRSPAAADDLVQDVLLITFQSLRAGQVREPERLASFVLGTSRRVVAGLRRGGARRERLLERFGPDLGSLSTDAEPQLDVARLAECLRHLSERERSVIFLSFYAERGSEEIGTELGLSAGNVRVVRYRALARLRACVAGGKA